MSSLRTTHSATPASTGLQIDESDSLILLHQQKIDELQKLHAEIPILTEALKEDPKNVAIAERLARAQDVSKDVDYLTIGPHLIIEYMNATTDQQRMEVRERFYREALRIESPPLPTIKREHVAALNQSTTTKQRPIQKKNTQPRSKKTKALPSNEKRTAAPSGVKWQDAAGDCASCGTRQSTFFNRSTGDRTCMQCGVAYQDNITFDWQDLSYDEKMEANIDVKNWRPGPDDQLEDQFDEEGNPRMRGAGEYGMNGFNDSEATGGNKYKYECRSYMLERLLSVQCLEHAKISAEDFQTIYATLQKHRQYSVDGWTATDMRQFLKICKLPR